MTRKKNTSYGHYRKGMDMGREKMRGRGKE